MDLIWGYLSFEYSRILKEPLCIQPILYISVKLQFPNPHSKNTSFGSKLCIHSHRGAMSVELCPLPLVLCSCGIKQFYGWCRKPRRTDILTCSSFHGVGPALDIHPCSLSHKDNVDRRPQAGLVPHVTLPLLFVGSYKELM